MKKIYILLASMFVMFCYAQEGLPVEDGIITFEKVIDSNNKSKDDLFNLSLEFASKYLRNSNDEIRLKDKDTGKIIVKSSERYNGGMLSELITIETKDNKSRIKVSNMFFAHDNYPNKIFNVEDYPKSWLGKKGFYKSLPNVTNRIIVDYGNYITKGKKDDW